MYLENTLLQTIISKKNNFTNKNYCSMLDNGQSYGFIVISTRQPEWTV